MGKTKRHSLNDGEFKKLKSLRRGKNKKQRQQNKSELKKFLGLNRKHEEQELKEQELKEQELKEQELIEGMAGTAAKIIHDELNQ